MACRFPGIFRRFALRNRAVLFAVLLLSGLGPATVYGQFSNARTQIYPLQGNAIRLDTLSVLPPLISIRNAQTGEAIPDTLFSIQNNLLLFDSTIVKKAYPTLDSIQVQYRVFHINFSKVQSRIDTALIGKASRDDAIEFDFRPYNPPSPLLGGNVTSNGAYTRGLSFGNNQNLVFNSNLNLQLNGRLGNDVALRAAISDNSVPLQPDGTTRQLQEFDRVYIQLQKKGNLLTAGDFDLRRPESSYFSNYFKRLQGGMVESTLALSNGDSLNLRAGAAVSKGKFARQTILGQEGNQGPYRLQGADGERFIIVLAGTEKVFIDGVLMQRGLAEDYVIDYNLGELTFTAQRLITKDIRIIIEFEYAVQAYLRSTAAVNADFHHGNQRFFVHAYSEQDGINSAGAQELSVAEREALLNAGDQLSQAFATGIDTLENGFDPARIQYKLKDTVACGVLYQILEYSTNPDSARFTSRFTEVPAGQGNYILAQTSANGRVFEWVGPDSLTCQPQGNYEPVVPLRAPELRQLFTAGADLRLGSNTKVYSELALSNRDFNRFSNLGNRDNQGLALISRAQHQFKGKADSSRWKGGLSGSYELTARDFRALNQYRPQEYLRDWNLSLSDQRTAEHIAQGGFWVENKAMGKLDYQFSLFDRHKVYSGTRHLGRVIWAYDDFKFDATANFLNSTGNIERTRFSRPKFDLSYTYHRSDSSSRKPIFTIGVYGERERNQRLDPNSDTLLLSSFWYDLGRIYLRSPERTQGWQVGAYIGRRDDFFPTGSVFTQNTRANEVNLNGKYQTGRSSTRQSFRWSLSRRTLQIVESELTDQEAQNTYLGRIDYSLAAFRNAITLTTGYELSSGQSPRLEYNYLLVNPGEGQYTWVDRNQDSILQVNEMEIAIFQDQASYIRVAVTTTDYIRTNNALFNQNIRIEPRLIWANSKKKWQRFVGRFTAQSTFQFNRRVFDGLDGFTAWNPTDLNIPDSLLVTASASSRNILFFNRANPVWDASISRLESRNRLQVTTGFESRINRSHVLHGRVNLNRQLSIESDFIWAEKDNITENFETRNFEIASTEIAPKINLTIGRSLRLASTYRWSDNQNQLPTAENARINSLQMEFNWSPTPKPGANGFRPATILRLKGTYSDIQFTGEANTPLSYSMLEGLQNGENFLWNIFLDRQLSQTLQLSLNYEGRKTGGSNRVIHIGRAQVRALF